MGSEKSVLWQALSNATNKFCYQVGFSTAKNNTGIPTLRFTIGYILMGNDMNLMMLFYGKGFFLHFIKDIDKLRQTIAVIINAIMNLTR